LIALALGSLLVAVMAAGLFVPLEAWFPRGESRADVRAVAFCFGLFLLNTQLMSLVGEPLLAAATFAVDLPLVARVVVAMLLGDLLAYAIHRAMHASPLLWRFHQLHHAPHHLRFWDGWRVHPVDFVAHGLSVGLPAALLGVPLADFVGLVLLRKAYTLYLHADLSFTHGRFAWLLASPRWHAAHHETDRDGKAVNFATTFPFIDRLFGTDQSRYQKLPTAV
jgi:sterol desaturase/sphingolipid hydroxylase (fatty acid hydroxylase superfamily)